MADKKKGITIVIKRVQGSTVGAHGGAWKVAFADFMTALMSFFLVMWLMGTDEETRKEIAHYFNHPNTPYKAGRDPDSAIVVPLGEKKGLGDSVINGLKGETPEEMVQTPLKDLKDLFESSNFTDIAFGVELDADIDVMKFSLLGDEVFEKGTTDIRNAAKPKLEKIANLLKKYPGYVLVEGHLDNTKALSGDDPYLFSTARAVAIMNYFTKPQKGRDPANIMDENRFCPRGVGSRRVWSMNGADVIRNRRIEFTLSLKNPCAQ